MQQLERFLKQVYLESRRTLRDPGNPILFRDPQRVLEWLFPLYLYLDKLLVRAWRVSIGIQRFQQELQVLPEPIQSWWREIMLRLITGNAKRLAKQIADELVKGIEAGEGERELAQRIKPILQDYRAWQLYRIVRTETLRAYNLAQITTTASISDVSAWRYSVVLDDRTSAICKFLAGKVATRATLRYVPPLHPHCRTILVPLFEGEYAPNEILSTPDVVINNRRVVLQASPLPQEVWNLIRSGKS